MMLSAGLGVFAGEGARAAECTWQRHTQRVVKKVKRHGKVRRVVRFKPRWTCVPAVAPVASTPPAAPPPPTPAPPAGEEEAVPRRVSVKADDDTPEAFSFGLSRPYVVAGEVTIELNNSEGGDPHNLNVRLEGSEAAPLGANKARRRSGRSRLARPHSSRHATPTPTQPLSGGHMSIGANSWFESCEKWWVSIPKRTRPPARRFHLESKNGRG